MRRTSWHTLCTCHDPVHIFGPQGAAALISNKAYLTKAAGILAVEAYHGEATPTPLCLSEVMQPHAALSYDATAASMAQCGLVCFAVGSLQQRIL